MIIPKMSSVRSALQIGLTFFVLLGCARVSLDTKKPIQVDVKMRVDIYQHVAQDVANIEDLISSEPKGKQVSFFFLGEREAWAETDEEEGYPADVLRAIERRKARRNELVRWEQRGVIGENRIGKVELADPAFSDKDVIRLMNEENEDRSIIYSYVAEKNLAGVEETGRVFAQRIQADAPPGTSIQSSSGEWTIR